MSCFLANRAFIVSNVPLISSANRLSCWISARPSTFLSTSLRISLYSCLISIKRLLIYFLRCCVNWLSKGSVRQRFSISRIWFLSLSVSISDAEAALLVIFLYISKNYSWNFEWFSSIFRILTLSLAIPSARSEIFPLSSASCFGNYAFWDWFSLFSLVSYILYSFGKNPRLDVSRGSECLVLMRSHVLLTVATSSFTPLTCSRTVFRWNYNTSTRLFALCTLLSLFFCGFSLPYVCSFLWLDILVAVVDPTFIGISVPEDASADSSFDSSFICWPN